MGSLKQHLRLSALLEGISFLLLLGIAMPLKYMAGLPQFVTVIGLLHGILFIWYVVAVMLGRETYRFTNSQTGIALVGSLLPFGTFYADKKIFKNL